MNHVFLIGHSHTQCIVEALNEERIECSWAPFLPSEVGTFIDPDGSSFALNAATQAALQPLLRPESLCISTIAGNACNFLALVEWDPPLDFYSPNIPVPPREGLNIIPYGTIKASFAKKLLSGDLTMLEGAKRSLPSIRYHIESPPPVRDNDTVMALLDPYFRETYPNARVANPWLRLKMWNLQSEICKEKCAELGVEYISAPPESMDSDGFLWPALLSSRSSTHANKEYGKMVSSQIRGLMI